ncbi:hypothetical protein [Fulvivirga ulvae]|nr:hypothetical protein [Fulvivirga ulvae]
MRHLRQFHRFIALDQIEMKANPNFTSDNSKDKGDKGDKKDKK